MKGLKMEYRRPSSVHKIPDHLGTVDFSQPQYCATDVWLSKGPCEMVRHPSLAPVADCRHTE